MLDTEDELAGKTKSLPLQSLVGKTDGNLVSKCVTYYIPCWDYKGELEIKSWRKQRLRTGVYTAQV